ncbi:MAG: DNA internalization-related competence protein ComEC/Rec2 [Candidatus Binatia bacterium]
MIALSLWLVIGELLSVWFGASPVHVAAVASTWILARLGGALRLERTLRPALGVVTGLALVTWTVSPPARGCVVPAAGPSEKIWLDATVTSDAVRLGEGSRMEVRAVVRRGARAEAICGTLLLTLLGQEPPPEVGERIRFHAHLRRPSNFQNPGAYDQVGALARRGIWATAYGRSSTVSRLGTEPAGWRGWIAHRRRRIGAIIDESVDDPERGLLRALVIGDTGGVSDEIRDDVARTGIAHLLSVSGLHVGIVWGVLFAGLYWLGSRSDWLLLHLDVRALAGLAAAPAAVFYGALAGGRQPTTRAVWMTLLLTIAVACGREIRSVRALILAAAGLCIVHPGAPLDVSFQLSFASVAALIAGMDRWLARRERRRRTLVGPWRQRRESAAVVPFAALVGTAPLVAWHFNWLTPIGLLTNPILVPGCGVPATLLGLAGAAATFVSDDASRLLFRLAGWPLAAFARAVALAAEIPFGSVRVPTPTLIEIGAAYALLTLPWQPARWRGRAVPVIVLVLVADLLFWAHERWLHEDVRVRFLDVGQGDAAVIELPGGRTVVVDGGGFPKSHFDVGERVVARYLRTRRILRVDVLAASHGDWDHQAGLAAIARDFSPRELWRAAVRDDRLSRLEGLVTAGGGTVRTLRRGEVALSIGGVSIECVHPPEDARLSPNDGSLVLRLSFGSISFVFAGDVEASGELLLRARPEIRGVTVLKVPHHGSRTSSTAEFLGVARPAFGVFSLGAGNRWGFPHPDVLARYRAIGASIFRTDVDGSVYAWTDGLRVVLRPRSRASPAFCALLGAVC